MSGAKRSSDWRVWMRRTSHFDHGPEISGQRAPDRARSPWDWVGCKTVECGSPDAGTQFHVKVTVVEEG